MSDPIEAAQRKADAIIGAARAEAARLQIYAGIKMNEADRLMQEAQALMAQAKREIERMRIESQALEGKR